MYLNLLLLLPLLYVMLSLVMPCRRLPYSLFRFPHVDIVVLRVRAQVTFGDVIFEKSDNACRVKSHANGTGRVSGIIYRNVTMTDVLWPILVDGFYGSGSQGGNAVLLENITFDGVRGTVHNGYFSTGPKFHCDKVQPCTGIVLRNVNITGSKRHQKVKMSCENVHGTATNVTPTSCLDRRYDESE